MECNFLTMIVAPLVMLIAPEAQACTTRLPFAGTSSSPLALLEPSAPRSDAHDQPHADDRDVVSVTLWIIGARGFPI
jgi:hypothetical protein